MIVSDTSPLRYLVAVQRVDLLPNVFEEVLIPPAVLGELTHPRGLPVVRQWVEKRPDWLNVQRLQSPPPIELTQTLDAGQCETIPLAIETRPDFVLMDERSGRRAANTSGLSLIGALGVLRESHRRGELADPIIVLQAMRNIGFRVSQPLYEEFLRQIQVK